MKSGLLLSTYNEPNIRRPHTLISSVIRLFTAGKYTHSAITIQMWGEVFVIDSDWSFLKRSGIEMRPWNEWKKNRPYVHIFDPRVLTDKTEKAYCLKVTSQLGKGYDLKQIRPILEYEISGIYKGQTDYKASDKYICSEFFAWSYGLKDWFKRTPINLWNNRFNDFPQGVDLFEGNPKDLEI